MSLKDRILSDIDRVFINKQHFASEHTWNGKPITCVVDDDIALKRKNNNVVDVSWDNNSTETLIFVPVKDFPGRLQPNEHILFDGKGMKVSQFNENGGVYEILLVSQEARGLST